MVNVEGLANPVRQARALLDEDATVLAGEGALARARQLGLPEADVRTAEAIAAWEQQVEGRTAAQGVWLHMDDRSWQAGLVALDAGGHWSVVHTTPAMWWQVVAPGQDHCHDRPWVPPRKPGT